MFPSVKNTAKLYRPWSIVPKTNSFTPKPLKQGILAMKVCNFMVLKIS